MPSRRSRRAFGAWLQGASRTGRATGSGSRKERSRSWPPPISSSVTQARRSMRAFATAHASSSFSSAPTRPSSSRSSKPTSSASCAPAQRAASRRGTSQPRGRRTLGVIGCGWQAESQLACMRAAVPGIERVVAYCRTEEKRLRVLRGARRGAGRKPSGSRRLRRRRHRDHVARPGPARRVAARRRARLRGRCERRPQARARQRRPRARCLRLLRLARRREARVRRPDRADRVGRPRLARGARAAGGRRGRVGGPPVGRGHRRLQVQRARRVGRGRRGCGGRARAAAGVGREVQ